MLRTRLAIAVAVSAMVIMSAPFVRDIRDFIKTTFPGHYVTVVVAVVALAVTAAIVAAIARIRDRRAARYGAIAAALALAVSHAWWNAQGNLEVDAVERFHFVEYGLVTFLYYRAFRALGDVSGLGISVLAGLIVGTCEEWLQWFIPGRIGDMRDVFLNGAAIVSGLLFSIGVDPPAGMSFVRRPDRCGALALLQRWRPSCSRSSFPASTSAWKSSTRRPGHFDRATTPLRCSSCRARERTPGG